MVDINKLKAMFEDPNVVLDRATVTAAVDEMASAEVCGCGTIQEAFDASLRHSVQVIDHDCLNWLIAVTVNQVQICKLMMAYFICNENKVPLSDAHTFVTSADINAEWEACQHQYGVPFLSEPNYTKIRAAVQQHFDKTRGR